MQPVSNAFTEQQPEWSWSSRSNDLRELNTPEPTKACWSTAPGDQGQSHVNAFHRPMHLGFDNKLYNNDVAQFQVSFACGQFQNLYIIFWGFKANKGHNLEMWLGYVFFSKHLLLHLGAISTILIFFLALGLNHINYVDYVSCTNHPTF